MLKGLCNPKKQAGKFFSEEERGREVLLEGLMVRDKKIIREETRGRGEREVIREGGKDRGGGGFSVKGQIVMKKVSVERESELEEKVMVKGKMKE